MITLLSLFECYYSSLRKLQLLVVCLFLFIFYCIFIILCTLIGLTKHGNVWFKQQKRSFNSLYWNDKNQKNRNSLSSSCCGAVLGSYSHHFQLKKFTSWLPRLTLNFPWVNKKTKISNCSNQNFDCRFEICMKNSLLKVLFFFQNSFGIIIKIHAKDF